jgi:predicted phosphodiesterase
MRDIWEPEKQWHEKQQSVKIMVLPDMHGNYPTLQMNQVSQPDALIILGDWLEKFEIERVRNDIFKNDANPHVDRSLITTFQQWAAPLFNVTTTTPIIVPGNKERNSTYRADSYQNIPANRWVFLNQCASQSSEPTRNPTYVVLKNHVIVLGYTTTARPEDRDPRWGKQSDQTNRLMDHLRSACSANPQCNKILLAAHEKLVELATSGTLKAMRRAAPNHSILILTSHDHTESLRWMIEKGKIDNPKNPFPNYFKVSDFSKWFKGGWISLQSIGSSNFRESEYQNMYWNAPPPFGLCPTVLEIPASLP